jgi:hypothetical protein
LLDQIPPVDLAVRGQAVVDLLRPADLALADHPGIREAL